MYEFRPQRTNNRAQNLIILLFAGAAALFLLTFSLKGLPFLWVIQLLAILLLVAAIFLVTRYLTKSYEYALIPDGDGTDLTVTEISSGGRKRITVCRISLSGIEDVRVLEENGASVRALHKEGKNVFDYRPDLSPDRSLLVEATEGGEKFALFLAYGEEFLSILENNRNGQNI